MIVSASPQPVPKVAPPAGSLTRRPADGVVPDISVSVVATRAGFEALEKDWNDLFGRCTGGALVFQTFNWNWHWANIYLSEHSGDCHLAIIAMRRGDRLVSVWPLVVTRLFGTRIVEWMGSPVSQYGDILIDPAEDAPSILASGWKAIAEDLRVDALHLRKVRADAHVLALLQKRRAEITFRSEAPFLDIASAADPATYETRYSGKTRKNRRRLARRLAEVGPMRIEHLSDSPQAADAAREAVALRLRTLCETGRVSPALQDARYARFFAEAAGGTMPCGCRVTRIIVGDRLAAASIDVSQYGHRAAHIIAHEPALDACGPGVTMVGDWLHAAFEDGMSVLDLLAPAHGYKWDWADSSIEVSDYAVARSWLGRVAVVPYLVHVRPRLKEAVERWMQWRAGDHARGDRAQQSESQAETAG